MFKVSFKTFLIINDKRKSFQRIKMKISILLCGGTIIRLLMRDIYQLSVKQFSENLPDYRNIVLSIFKESLNLFIREKG